MGLWRKQIGRDINHPVQPRVQDLEVRRECSLRVSTLNYLAPHCYGLKRDEQTLRMIVLPRPPPPDITAQASPSCIVQPKSRSNGMPV